MDYIHGLKFVLILKNLNLLIKIFTDQILHE